MYVHTRPLSDPSKFTPNTSDVISVLGPTTYTCGLCAGACACACVFSRSSIKRPRYPARHLVISNFNNRVFLSGQLSEPSIHLNHNQPTNPSLSPVQPGGVTAYETTEIWKVIEKQTDYQGTY